MPTRTSPGSFEIATMLAVSILPALESHATVIAHTLTRTFGIPASVSAVHSTLRRLQEKSLIALKLGQPTNKQGGRSKRLFRVTAAGKRTLSSARKVAKRMWGG